MRHTWGFVATAVFVFLIMVGAVAASDLVGTWTNEEGTFSFGADQSVEVRTQGQVWSGMWAAEGNMLMLQLDTGTMLFQAGIDGDTLMLADANGTYVLTRAAEQPAEPTAHADASFAQQDSGAPLSDRQFLAFVEYYRQMPPDVVAEHLARITPEQAQSFTIWEALGSDIHFMACQGRYAGSIVWQSLSGPMGCGHLIAERQQTVALAAEMGMGDPFAEAEIQRLQVVNMYKCSLGIHPPDVCGTYASTQAAAGEALAGIGQTMNVNMGCTEQWEQQGNDPNTRVFLGCW